MLDYIILENLKKLMGEKFPLVVQSYLDSSAKLIEELENAIKVKDAEKIVITAHTFKSSSAQVGALQLQSYLQNIEGAATHANLDNLDQIFYDSKREFELVCEALKLY